MSSTSPASTAPNAATTAADPATPAPARSAEEIQADIDAAHERLAATVDELQERLSPQSLLDEAKHTVRSVFVDDSGAIKRKPVAIVVGTVVGLVVLRAIFHRD